MRILVCFKKKYRAKATLLGNTLDGLVMFTIILQMMAEKVAKEKGLSIEAAVNFVLNNAKEGCSHLEAL